MLICDSILQGKLDRDPRVTMTLGDGFAQLQEHIRDAQKFVLDRSMAAAADAVETPEVERILSMCRVPFQTVWIECLQADRPKFFAAPLSGGRQYMGITDDNQLTAIRAIKRIGLLIRCHGDSRLKFTAHLGWSFQDDFINMSLLSLDLDLTERHADLSGYIRTKASPYYLSLYKLLASRELGGISLETSTELQQVMREAMADWAAEPQFWLAVLALLNCRNVAATKTVDVSAVNVARAKRGRPPFAEHKILTLRLPAARREAGVNAAGAGREAVRGHFVRGHFKQRRTGLFYWSDFVRGDTGRMLHKTYKPTLKEDA